MLSEQRTGIADDDGLTTDERRELEFAQLLIVTMQESVHATLARAAARREAADAVTQQQPDVAQHA